MVVQFTEISWDDQDEKLMYFLIQMIMKTLLCNIGKNVYRVSKTIFQ